MGIKHKQYDYIVAWAAGEEIEYLEEGGWYPLPPLVPPYYEDCKYRIKPKIVKREGWMNVYYSSKTEYKAYYHATKEIADEKATSYRKACVHVKWEEEE
jgi:hypothetical protein